MAIDDKISNIIQGMFPQYFAENGPILIQFVKAYYEYLEQANNVLWYARQHVNNRDVDKSIEQFLIHFKNKYVPDIQLNTVIATRDMVKQSIPFYRSKGTDNNFELFFRSVFGTECEIYHPQDDVFTLSSGNWQVDHYLEISPFANNFPFIGQEILGLESGAYAFVDRYVRRIINERMVDVFYISAITGTFTTGEQLTLKNSSQPPNSPIVVGSMNYLEIVNGSENFNVGDTVSIYSNSGVQGEGIVSSIQTETGLISFTLTNGGWGYGPNVEVFVSNYELYLTNIARPIALSNTYITLLGSIYQPLCTIQYAYATGNIKAQDTLSVYNSSGNVIGQGTVLKVIGANSVGGTGNLICSNFLGNLASNTVYYTQGNLVTANLVAAGYADITANGLLLTIPTSNVIAYYNSATGPFQVGSNVYQIDLSNNMVLGATIVSVSPITGSSGYLTLNNCSTCPFTNSNLYVVGNTTTYANLSSLSFGLGIQSNSNFYNNPGNFIFGNNFFTSGSIQSIGTGYGATFSVANTRNNQEESTFSNNPLFPYLGTQLNVTNYGNNLHYANLTAVTLGDALSFITGNLGSIVLLANINPGQNYQIAPSVLIIDPVIAYFYRRDFIFNISNPTGVFKVGEIITQPATGGKGLVKAANTSVLSVGRLNFQSYWIANLYTNSQYLLVGEDTGFMANLTAFQTDIYSLPIGADSVVVTNVFATPGSVSSINVTSSGFAFDRSINYNGVQEDLITFTSANGLYSGTAFAALSGQGKSSGYYTDQNGFLSSDKKLTDSYYYTPFSYEVRTSVSPNLYEDMLKKVLHTAGKIYFMAVYRQSIVNVSSSIVPSWKELKDTYAVNMPQINLTATARSVTPKTVNPARITAYARNTEPYAMKVVVNSLAQFVTKNVNIIMPPASVNTSTGTFSVKNGSNVSVILTGLNINATATKVTITHT